jgi:hypothetical protein
MFLRWLAVAVLAVTQVLLTKTRVAAVEAQFYKQQSICLPQHMQLTLVLVVQQAQHPTKVKMDLLQVSELSIMLLVEVVAVMETETQLAA